MGTSFECRFNINIKIYPQSHNDILMNLLYNKMIVFRHLWICKFWHRLQEAKRNIKPISPSKQATMTSATHSGQPEKCAPILHHKQPRARAKSIARNSRTTESTILWRPRGSWITHRVRRPWTAMPSCMQREHWTHHMRLPFQQSAKRIQKRKKKYYKTIIHVAASTQTQKSH